MESKHFDVVVVGAGISGIGAGYYLQTKSPNKTFCIIEGRDNIGGTWDLFNILELDQTLICLHWDML